MITIKDEFKDRLNDLYCAEDYFTRILPMIFANLKDDIPPLKKEAFF